MSMSFAGIKLRERLALVIVTLIISGCARSGLHHVRPDIASIEPDKSAVIFSVLTAELPEEQNLEFGWVGRNGKYQSGNVDVSSSSIRPRVFALEVPGNRLVLGAIRIKIGLEWWQTTQQKEFELRTGQVSYIGRIEIQKFRSVELYERRPDKQTGERRMAMRPDSISVRFSDQSASDLETVKTGYKLLDARTVARRIPEDWEVKIDVTTPMHANRGRNSLRDAGILLEFLGAILSVPPEISLFPN